jgi:hypothetical protein
MNQNAEGKMKNEKLKKTAGLHAGFVSSFFILHSSFAQ